MFSVYFHAKYGKQQWKFSIYPKRFGWILSCFSIPGGERGCLGQVGWLFLPTLLLTRAGTMGRPWQPDLGTVGGMLEHGKSPTPRVPIIGSPCCGTMSSSMGFLGLVCKLFLYTSEKWTIASWNHLPGQRTCFFCMCFHVFWRIGNRKKTNLDEDFSGGQSLRG